MSIITIDCGASFIKGALFQNGIMKKQLQLESPQVHGNEIIRQTDQINALVKLVRRMILELSSGLNTVRLCVSNEMHGFLLAYDDGCPYTDYISWQKEYGNIIIADRTAVQELSDPTLQEDISYTGMPLRAGLPSANLLYLHNRGYLSGDKLCFYTLGDYILKCLSGKDIVCHPTNAAATGLFDLRCGNWNRKLLEKTTLKKVDFPVIGVKPIDFNMDGIKIEALPAIGDQQAALYGAGLSSEGDLSFNLGTGAQVSKISHRIDCSGTYQIRPYFDGMYIKSIPHLPSGRALNVYFRLVKDIIMNVCFEKISDDEIWKCILKAEKEASETHIQCDLSFFENPITSHRNGALMNIEEYSLSMGTVFKSIFNQMACNFLWAAHHIEPDVSNVERIIFSGGIARKITAIRRKILSGYSPKVRCIVAEDETMLGLYQYGINYFK